MLRMASSIPLWNVGLPYNILLLGKLHLIFELALNKTQRGSDILNEA